VEFKIILASFAVMETEKYFGPLDDIVKKNQQEKKAKKSSQRKKVAQNQSKFCN
jgi:hypothetical protein